MDIREYLDVLRRRAWIPILLVIVAVMSTGAVAYLAKPEYTATATVLARGGGNANQTLSFNEVVTSNSLALRVLHKLKLTESVDSLSSQITVASGRTTNLYLITVRDTDPTRAEKIANTAAT